MANCNVYLQGAIPPRFQLESENNNILYASTYTGYSSDSSNITPSTADEWDSEKTDYKIEDIVKIGALGEEYQCGQDGSRAYPPASEFWKKLGTINELRYKDGSPKSLAIINNVGAEPDGANIEIFLNLGLKDNFVFIQNMKNVKKVKIEKDNGDGTFILIMEKDTFVATSFHPCICCLIEFGYETNFTYKLDDCHGISKLKVTLERVENTITGVGVCAVGEFVRLGEVIERPVGKERNDFKFAIEDRNLALPENVNSYIDYSLKLQINTADGNIIFRKILDNQHQLNFYEISELTTTELTIFVGTHSGLSTQLSNWETTPIDLNLYGILK